MCACVRACVRRARSKTLRANTHTHTHTHTYTEASLEPTNEVGVTITASKAEPVHEQQEPAHELGSSLLGQQTEVGRVEGGEEVRDKEVTVSAARVEGGVHSSLQKERAGEGNGEGGGIMLQIMSEAPNNSSERCGGDSMGKESGGAGVEGGFGGGEVSRRAEKGTAEGKKGGRRKAARGDGRAVLECHGRRSSGADAGRCSPARPRSPCTSESSTR